MKNVLKDSGLLKVMSCELVNMKSVWNWFGLTLLFWQITTCWIVQIIIAYCSLSTSCCYQVTLVVHVCEKLLCHYQVYGRSAWTRVANWKVIVMGRDGPGGSCHKKALNHEIFVASFLQTVERKRVLTIYGALAVKTKLYRQLSVTSVTTMLKNGTMEPSGSS